MLTTVLENSFYLVSVALLVLRVIMMVIGTVLRHESQPDPKLLEDIMQQRLDQIRQAERRSIAVSDRRRETVVARRQRYGSIG